MVSVGDVALLRPWWLLALPVLTLLFLLSRPRGDVLSAWRRAADPWLLAAMVARGGASGGGDRTPVILAVVLGVLALSGPALRRPDADRLRNLDAILVAIDLSQDVARGASLRVAASAAHDVLAHSAARQAGLILFAGDAYLASPLTDDANAIEPLLFSLDDATVPDSGVRPDLALALAGRVLRDSRIIRGDVVLISGGGGLDGEGARKEAAALRAAGHRVDTLLVSDPAGIAASRRAKLAGVASAGGGLADDADGPDRVLQALGSEAIRHLGTSAFAGIAWRDLGRFLLAGAALPLLFAFRRGTA